MATRPLVLPDWATGTNYGFGPYVGNPNKAQPPNANVTEGFDPQNGVPMEWLNYLFSNEAAWIDHHDGILLGSDFRLEDDFTGQSVDSGKWNIPSTASFTAPTTIDDSANGAYGTCSMNPAATKTSEIQTISYLGTGDFVLFGRLAAARVVDPSSEISFGMQGSGGQNIRLICANGLGFSNTHWVVQDNATLADSGVTVSSSYANFLIQRIGGAVTIKIAGSTVYTSANASTQTLNLTVFAQNGAGTGTYVYLDAVKLWMAR